MCGGGEPNTITIFNIHPQMVASRVSTTNNNKQYATAYTLLAHTCDMLILVCTFAHTHTQIYKCDQFMTLLLCSNHQCLDFRMINFY